MSERAKMQALARAFEKDRKTPTPPLNERAAISTVPIDLSSAVYTAAGGGSLGMAGYGLAYLRRGSHRGGLLTVFMGGKLESFGPGDVLYGYFEDLNLLRAAGSARSGFARLAVLRTPWTDFREAALEDSQLPVTLRGTFDADGVPTTYVAITENTDPTGTDYATLAAIDISGWRVAEVFCDGLSAAANATSWDMVPFVDPGYSGLWHEQGTQRVGIADSDTSGFRYRHFTLNLDGKGMLAFSVRNLLAAARTSVSIAVRGIR